MSSSRQFAGSDRLFVPRPGSLRRYPRVVMLPAVRVLPAEGGTTHQLLAPSATQAGMHAAVADLLRALETGDAPQCPPEEARKAVALALAILESQANGNAKVAVR